MEALVDLAFERDYERVSVEEIVRRADGRRDDFERCFQSKQACAVAALEAMTAENQRVVRAAFESEERWPDSLRTGAYAQARWIAGNPRKVRFLMLETLWASELTGALRDQFLGEYTAMIDAGRAVAPDPASIPPLAAESVIGAITQVIARYSSDGGEARDPIAAVPEMMYLAVRPYLGEETARRELTIPPPSD
jgi:AcrR family transcriptional regulator